MTSHSKDLEASYRRTVHELRALAKDAPHVTEDWILQVASMDEADMRRRLIRSFDWAGYFSHSLDGIEAIRNMGGGAPDGCWSHKEVRSVVLQLVDKIEALKAKVSELGSVPASASTAGLKVDPDTARKHWRCKNCATVTLGAKLLVAANPFDRQQTLTGCPHCKQCDDGFDLLCDEPGCFEDASCGWPTGHSDDAWRGYRNTCGAHGQAAFGRKEKSS